jgi:alpha-1,2-mannosyltransferase
VTAWTVACVRSVSAWTRPWRIELPIILAVLARGGTGSRVSALCGYLLFLLAPMWWTPHSGGPREYGLHAWLTLIANCYLVAGLVFLAYMTSALAGPAPVGAEEAGDRVAAFHLPA